MYVGAFGPITWDVLLLCALNYPSDPNEHKQKSMLQFILGLVNVLPCDGCSVHAVQYTKLHPPNVTSSNALVDYIVTFHNTVNSETGKRSYTVEEAKHALLNRYFKDGEEMSRAQNIRKEDCAKITELQTTISALQAKDRDTDVPKKMDNNVPKKMDNTNIIISISNIVLTLVILVILLYMTIKFKSH